MTGGCGSTANQPAEISTLAVPTPRPLAPRAQRAAAFSIATWWREFNRRQGLSNGSSSLAQAPRHALLASRLAASQRHPALQLGETLSGQPLMLNSRTTDEQARAILAFSSSNDLTSDLGFAHKWQTDDRAATALPGALRQLLQVSQGQSGREAVTAIGLPALRSQARARQLAALQLFLRDVKADQDVARTGERATLMAAINDDIERARRLSVDAIAPELLDDPIVLELTNLRLKLLSNSYKGEAGRAAARVRLVELETQWREILRRQESERRDLLVRLRDERPRAIAVQGQHDIAAALQTIQGRDETLRRDVGAEQRTRIVADFRLNQVGLGIVLPANSRLPSLPPYIASGHTSFPSNRTGSRPLSSASLIGARPRVDVLPDLPTVTSVEFATGLSTLRLRAMARSDQSQWARIIAQREAAWKKATTVRSPDNQTLFKAVAQQ